jgi:DNA-binding NarL/FixJ family response regulator
MPTASPDPIRCLVVDDDPGIREFIHAAVDAEPGMVVVAQAANGIEALKVARSRPVDVLLTDIWMPGLDGVSAARRIRAEADRGRRPAPAVVFLITVDQESQLDVAEAVPEAGFVLKDSHPQLIAAAIRSGVGRGGRQPQAAQLPQAAEPDSRLQLLSGRERDVLLSLCRGLSNRQVARSLAVSEATVKTHVRNLLAKLGVRSRTEAVVLVFRSGLPGS